MILKTRAVLTHASISLPSSPIWALSLDAAVLGVVRFGVGCFMTPKVTEKVYCPVGHPAQLLFQNLVLETAITLSNSITKNKILFNAH